MASSATVITNKPLEDPLAHLPCSCITEYRRGQTIYHQGHASPPSIYVVIGGKVKVSRLTDDGRDVLLDIYRKDDVFGESAFLRLSRRSEQAVALENTRLMSWTTDELEAVMKTRTGLAIALLQILAQRTLDHADRIERFSVDNNAQRLAHSLVRFSERLGAPAPDGSVRMPPIKHQLLSQYVGTSREVITWNLNQFRREGFLNYSRTSMSLFPHTCKEWIRKNAASRKPGV